MPSLRAIFLAAVVCLSRVGAAQPATAELDGQLSAMKQQLAAPSLAPAQRVELINRCDELQRRLIALAPADERVATWLADRAAAALDLATLDPAGADVSVLYGVPTAGELKAVRTRAADALDLAKRADAAATLTVARLEAQLVGGQARAETVEQSLHTLVDVEQAQRIPYLRALASMLHGATSIDDPTRESAQAAARMLGALPTPAPATGPLAQSRALALGTALLHASIGLGDRAPDALRAATAQLQPLCPSGGPATATSLKARLALIRAGQTVSARQRSENAAADRELDALEADARAASYLDRAAREPAGRNLLLSSAIRELLSTVEGTPGVDAATRDALRLRAYDKIAAAVPASVPVEKLPPEAMLARAVTRVREAGPGDSVAREDAIGLLTKLAAREDASAALKAQARWERAVIVAAAADPAAEIDALSSVVRLDAQTERAVSAARRIVELFARREAAVTELGANPPEPYGTRLPVLRESVVLLLRRDAPQVDRWRREAARLAERDLANPAKLDAARLDRALDIAGPVLDSGGSSIGDALADSLWRALEARRGPASAASDRASPALASHEWEEVVPLATRVLAWARSHDAAREPAYTLLLGEALVGAGNTGGQGMLSGLVGGPIDRPDSPLWPRYKLALAQVHKKAGQNAEAVAAFREVAERLEGAPGSSRRDPAYWAAWCEMIAIQQAQNADSSRSADIRVQIKRLELIDPNLGGMPWSDRIRQVRIAIGE